MQSPNQMLEQKYKDDDLDILEFLRALKKGKWSIIIVTLISSFLAVIFSLSLPNIYQSKTILAPLNSSKNVSNAIQSYGSLASFAGVSLPSQANTNKSVKALEKLKSLSFFKENILPNIALPELMAVDSWDADKKILLFRKDIYNVDDNTWIGNAIDDQKKIPSEQESYRMFKSHLSINEDKQTGFITISVDHKSPYVAQNWAKILVDQINIYYREEDRKEAEKAIAFLNKQILNTSFAEIKQVVATLLQQETQKLTLIEAKESYIFDFIDPPAVMERKISPKRDLICIIGALIGVMLGILLALFQNYKHVSIRLKND